MAKYKMNSSNICPRCSLNLQRNSASITTTIPDIGRLFDKLGFSARSCPKCGIIPIKEFPRKEQERYTRNSLILTHIGCMLIVLFALLLNELF
ncbi:MAG TPA: hypothetical protein VMU29_05610 [Smithella sp.]|nr:hypothetical protein [Smithella sp.]